MALRQRWATEVDSAPVMAASAEHGWPLTSLESPPVNGVPRARAPLDATVAKEADETAVDDDLDSKPPFTNLTRPGMLGWCMGTAGVGPIRRTPSQCQRLWIGLGILLVLLALAIGLGVALTAAPQDGRRVVPSDAGRIRAIYLWDEAPCLLPPLDVSAAAYVAGCHWPSPPAYREALFERLLLPWGTFPAFTRLYLSLNLQLLNEQRAEVQQLLADIHARGFYVEWLAGEPTWVLSTLDRQIPVEYCQRVVDFNRAAPSAAQRWDGIHYDIEPHTLPGWNGADPYEAGDFRNDSNSTDSNDNGEINEVYQTNFLYIYRQCNALLAPSSLIFSAAYPFWYYPLVMGLWTPLVQEQFVDYVVFMHYFNNLAEFVNGSSDAALGGVEPLLEALDERLPAVFIAEVAPPFISPPWISFWSQGTAALETMLAQVQTRFRARRGFWGLGVHYSTAYYAVPPDGPPELPDCTYDGGNRTVVIDVGRLDAGSVGVYARPDVPGGLRPVVAQLTLVPANLERTTVELLLDTDRPGPYTVRAVDGPDLLVLDTMSVVTEAPCTDL